MRDGNLIQISKGIFPRFNLKPAYEGWKQILFKVFNRGSAVFKACL